MDKPTSKNRFAETADDIENSAPIVNNDTSEPVVVVTPKEPTAPPANQETLVSSPPTETPIEELPENKGRYSGDLIDNTPPLDGDWETIPFESPFELICYFDRHINAGTVTLHNWQAEVNEELAFIGKPKPHQHSPYRLSLCAANGSGKDAYVIAPFVVWFALTKVRSLTVITSSSGVQLTAQTENYISALCNAVNNHYKDEQGRPVRIFKITKRFIRCLKSGSEIRMFATDEAGKAEGYHPLEPNSEMAIIVNEAKSVAPDIFGALSRCTGYNYWLNVSTPGEPMGDFHDSFYNWANARRVTAFDCPHLGKDHIDEVARKYGLASAIYRSQILAEFTAIGGQTVINQDFLNKCIDESFRGWVKPKRFGRKRIGLDLAAGGDECSFVCVHGNEIVDEEHFREADTTVTESRAIAFLTKHGGSNECDIFADDGGVGHGILDRLVKKFSIVRVLNQQRAFDHKQFGNRGAEMWFQLGRMIEERVVVLKLSKLKEKNKPSLYEQLAYRFYKKNETSGRITLESKSEAKSNGHCSPDRADAYVLAMSGTNWEEIAKAIATSDKKEAGMTIEQIQLEMWTAVRAEINRRYEEAEGSTSGPLNNSLEVLFSGKGY